MRICRPYLAVLVILLFASCVSGPSSGPVIYVPVPTNTPTPNTSSTEPGEDQFLPGPAIEVAITMPRPPITLDPARVALMDDAGRNLIENIYIGLTYLDPDTGQVEPWLAESWDVSDDGLLWLFRLREDIWWISHDPETGALMDERRVIANDVVYAIRRACELGVNAPTTHPLFVIEGCQETALVAATGTSVNGTIPRINALDDTTVEVWLTDPAPYLATLFAMPVARPIPWENVDNGWPLPEALWISGPWMIEQADDNTIALSRNPFWSTEEMGNLERLTMTFGGGNTGESHTLTYPQATFAIFSLEATPTDNVHIRRALALATDRALFADWGVPLTTFAPPGAALAPENAPSSPSPDAAQRELAEAGYEECGQMWTITILTDESPVSGAMAERLAASWANALDCPESTFEIEQQSLDRVMTIARNTDSPTRQQVILFHWQGDYADAHHWLADIFGCRESFPRAFLAQGRACSSGDEYLVQATGETDPEARAALYAEVHDEWFAPDGEVIAIPLIAYTHSFFAPLGVAIRPSTAGPMRFDLWEIDVGAD